jgi:hypothetical protein
MPSHALTLATQRNICDVGRAGAHPEPEETPLHAGVQCGVGGGVKVTLIGAAADQLSADGDHVEDCVA